MEIHTCFVVDSAAWCAALESLAVRLGRRGVLLVDGSLGHVLGSYNGAFPLWLVLDISHAMILADSNLSHHEKLSHHPITQAELVVVDGGIPREG
jgi:hypothetical protein